MKPEIAALWTAALRSGEYKQGIGHLNSSGGFCCLGVLTDLFVKACASTPGMPKASWQPHLGDTDVQCAVVDPWPDPGENARAGSLHDAVQQWAGAKSALGNIDGGGQLAALNDSTKYSFAQLADLIAQKHDKL